MTEPRRTIYRSYKIKLLPNRDKRDTAFYLINRFHLYTRRFLSEFFFNKDWNISTLGQSKLANQAAHKARSIIRAQDAAHAATGRKRNIPEITDVGVPVEFTRSNSRNFDFFVRVPNYLFRCKVVLIPGKSHKSLNKSLKEGWELTNFGDLRRDGDELYLIARVKKSVKLPTPIPECLGGDVGISRSVVTSDGYRGRSLNEVVNKYLSSKKERDRQQSKFKQPSSRKKPFKSYLKQIIDIEVKLAIARCLENKTSLAVESYRSLSKLKMTRAHNWARCYFYNRAEIVCRENSVFFVDVDSYFSSKTCSNCGNIGLRDRRLFNCTSCGMQEDADLNAAKVISHRGRLAIRDVILPKWNQKVVKK